MKRVLACVLCLFVYGCSMPSFPTVSAWMSGDADDEAAAGGIESDSPSVSSGPSTPSTGIETQSFNLAAVPESEVPKSEVSESEASESVERRHLTRSDVEDANRGVFRPRDFADAPGTWLDMAEIPHTRSNAPDGSSGETSRSDQTRQFSDSVNTPPSGAAGRVQVAEMVYEEMPPRPTLALAPPSAPAPAPAPAPASSNDTSAENAKFNEPEGLPEVDLTRPWTREAVTPPSDPVRPRLVREGETLPDLPSKPLPGIDAEAKPANVPTARQAQPAELPGESARADEAGELQAVDSAVPAPPGPNVTPQAKLRPAAFTSSSVDGAAPRPPTSSPAPEALRALLDTSGAGWSQDAASSTAASAPSPQGAQLKAGTYLVVGSFKSAQNAVRLAGKHNDLDARVLSVDVNGQSFHRVAVPVLDGDIEQTQERVLAAGFSSVWPLQR